MTKISSTIGPEETHRSLMECSAHLPVCTSVNTEGESSREIGDLSPYRIARGGTTAWWWQMVRPDSHRFDRGSPRIVRLDADAEQYRSACEGLDSYFLFPDSWRGLS